jgi:hypothetical protein
MALSCARRLFLFSLQRPYSMKICSLSFDCNGCANERRAQSNAGGGCCREIFVHATSKTVEPGGCSMAASSVVLSVPCEI